MRIKKIDANYCEIDIELQPYLVKYLCRKGGSNTMVLNPNTPLGQEVFRMLQHPPKGWRPQKITPDRLLHIRIAEHYIREGRLGQYISDYDCKRLARAIEIHFWDSCCSWIQERRLFNGEKMRSGLIKYRAAFAIEEDDYKFESMERRFKRWIEDRKLSMDETDT